MILWICIGIFAALLILGAPILLCLGLPPVIWLLQDGSIPNLVMGQKMYTAVDSFSLIAIPFFMLAGQVMERTGITEAMRLVFDDALPIIRDALPEIGTLRRVTAEFTQYSSRYDRVRAGEPHINAFDPALCNAAILDMGCYPIHALISMFGEPAHVSAEAYHLESGFEAGGIALLRYDGFVCEAIWSKVCKQAAPTTFMGEDGSILLDDINHIRRIWLVRRSGETVELPYREKLPNNMMYELREFAGYIASGTQPEKRNRDSILTAAVIEEARRQTGTLFGGI